VTGPAIGRVIDPSAVHENADAILALRLSAPRQSWGTSSKYDRRDTNRFPTKSGIVGLLANAQGRDYQDSVADLAALSLGIRIETPGRFTSDFHTVSDYLGRGLPSAEVNPRGVQKRNPNKFNHISVRDYIDDATFVAVLRGPATLIRQLADAVTRPARALYLGRRACVPTGNLLIGTYPAGDIDAVLSGLPWQASEWMQEVHMKTHGHCPSVTLDTAVDDPHGTDELNDVPLSFAVGERRFTVRKVRFDSVTVEAAASADAHAPLADPTANLEDFGNHDPFELLG
jgi:CRISPR system Cascade subunit CasD